MNAPSTVRVELDDRSYDIHIAPGLLGERTGSTKAEDSGSGGSSHEIFADAFSGLSSSLGVIVTDETVNQLYGDRLRSRLEPFFERVETLSMSAGETTKSVATMERLWKLIIETGADRRSVIVAFGGGVPGDVAGFLAATFARGIRFVQVPTTLLAQVDSSVGGKAGINLPDAKNIVGAFWQPAAVLIDPDVLKTLSDEQYQSGLAEVIKYGVIADAALFELLESNIDKIDDRDPGLLAEMIARCCRIKADVVARDEKETSGLRMHLNYGHTWGHAIESVCGYGEFTHGAAIAIGMNCAARLAIALGIADTELLAKQSSLIERLGLPGDLVGSESSGQLHDELLAAMKRDKKVLDGKLNLILPTKIGQVGVYPAPDDRAILDSFRPQS